SLDDIARLIDSKIQSSKYTTPAPAHQPRFVDQGRERLLMLAYRLGFPRPDNEDAVTLEELENFIDKELRSKLVPDNYYRQTFQAKKVFGMNTSMYRYNAQQPRKSSRKCSECGKSGHTKSSCPKKKKKSKAKKKTNYVENDSSSESSSSDSSSSDDSDSDSHICYGLKKKRCI